MRSSPPPRPDAAAYCRGLDKRFVSLGFGDVWRAALGGEAAGREAFQALAGVDLDVPRGQFVGLLGPNGAGKSTLLRTLGGIYTASAGDLQVHGKVSGVYELGVRAHLLQTGREFALQWLKLCGENGASLARLVEDIEDFAELREYFDQPLHTYSTGMRARLFFAVVTAVRADVYLIDELLSVGDEYFSAKSWRRIREKIAAGTSGVFATHDWAAMLRLCRTALLLEKGRTREMGPAADIVRTYVTSPGKDSAAARFRAGFAEPFHARTGEEVAWTLPIELVDVDEASFSMSVEALEAGGGWQHLLHVNPTRIGPGRGNWEVSIRLPKFPLRRGRYYVNAFLGSAPGTGSGEVYARRSWMNGNPIMLEVEGAAQAGIAELEMQWSAP